MFRLSAFNLYFDPCRGSLIVLGRALQREREDIFLDLSRGQERMFDISLEKHITLLRPSLESVSCNETCQKWNAFAFFSLYTTCLAKSSSSVESTSRSRACLITMAWLSIYGKKEVSLIGNVTSPDRMSTKTLSFPNRYFF